jgi:hypothetical protein
MTTFLIVTGCIIAYSIGGGFVAAVTRAKLISRGNVRGDGELSIPDALLFITVFWPVLALLMWTYFFVSDRSPENRNKKEIAQASHEAELAKIKSQEMYHLNKALSQI